MVPLRIIPWLLTMALCILPAAGQAQSVETLRPITPTEQITTLENGLTAVRFEGDDLFETFLAEGGAASDAEVAAFLTRRVMEGSGILQWVDGLFGCSTLAASTPGGQRLFGRNFDWQACQGMIVQAVPENGYASVSTVNMDFVASSGVPLSLLPDRLQALIALYAPLDGMNAAGLAVSVNMIQDSATIQQQTDLPDLTTTTAVRLLLNQAATVEEALTLLESYDLHGSMGMMVHFAIADAAGRSVVVEYIDNQMCVTDTPAVTNFYLTPGPKYGTGTSQSRQRYALLMELDHAGMSMDDMRDTLDSVSKDNFEGFESTEWSIVMNQHTGEMRYYHRENYGEGYVLTLSMEDQP